MVRWGQITEQKEDSWYHTMAKKIYRPDVYMKAVDELIKMTDCLRSQSFYLQSKLTEQEVISPLRPDFIDGKTYDGKKPNDYIDSFKIGLK